MVRVAALPAHGRGRARAPDPGAPAAAAATDGLGITAMQTAEMLRGKALTAQDEDLAARLDAALEALPDEAYVLPEYEQQSRGQVMGRRPSERGARRRGR